MADISIENKCSSILAAIQSAIILDVLGTSRDLRMGNKPLIADTLTERLRFKDYISENYKKLGLKRVGEGLPTLLYSGADKGCDYAIFVPSLDCEYDSSDSAVFFTEQFEEESNNKFNELLGKYESRRPWKSLIEYYSDKGDISDKRHNFRQEFIPDVIPELYPNIDIDALVKAYLESNDSILMLYGDPGTGKTTLIKQLVYGCAYQEVAYVKDQELIAKSKVWTQLCKYKMIIFDDLDCKLTEDRSTADAYASAFMSNLLSFSDGIVNPFERPKVVISTNQNITQVDSALIRPGRCFDFIHFKQLEVDYAKQIWVDMFKLCPDRFDILFEGVDLISQSSLVSEKNRAYQGSVTRHYIKGDERNYSIEKRLSKLGISVSESTDQRKKSTTSFR